MGELGQRATTSYLDGLGRTYREVSDAPEGRQVEKRWTFDMRGRVVQETRPHFMDEPYLVDLFEYDRLDRMTRHVEPGGRTTTIQYNRYVTRTDDPNGNRREVTKNAFDEIRFTREYPTGPNEAAVSTEYQYDRFGRVVTVIPPAPAAGEPVVPNTVIGYDRAGRRTSLNDPDLGIQSFFYDLVGNLKQTTDARGVVVTFNYDELSRLKNSFSNSATDPQLETLRYDEGGAGTYALGRLTSVSDGVGAHTYSYDPVGRMLGETHNLTGGLRFRFSNEYDRYGSVKRRRVLGSGSTVISDAEVSFDSQGFPKSLRENATGTDIVRRFDVDAGGRVRSIESGEGVSTEEGYSPANDFLSDIRISSGTKVIENLNYTFDPGGRITQIQDRLSGSTNRTFDYDHVDRLKLANGPFAASGANASQTFVYDKFGNLKNKNGSVRTYGRSTAGVAPVPHAATTVDGLPLTYDAGGNLLTYGPRSFQWDSRGRLSGVTTVGGAATTYRYDTSGRRVLSTATGAPSRYFVTNDFEWSSGKGTVHYFGVGRRLGSRTFPFTPETWTASVSPPSGEYLTPVLIAFAFSPFFMVLLLGIIPERRRLRPAVVLRAALVAGTCNILWLGNPVTAFASLSDTDEDGVPNYREQAIGSNPNNPDSDGDGYRDGLELSAGSNPTSSASRPVLSIGSTAAPSGASGVSGGTSLELNPLISSVANTSIVNGYAATVSKLTVNADADGDGVPAAWDLNDANFNQGLPPDLDGDGIPDNRDPDIDNDGVENSADPDDDNDGLTDSAELAQGTNSQRWDTDGDGLGDGSEPLLGTNPLLADSDNDGVNDFLDVFPTDPTKQLSRGAMVDGDVAPAGSPDRKIDGGDLMMVQRMVRESTFGSASQRARVDVAPSDPGIVSVADLHLLMRAARGDDVDGDGLSTPADMANGGNAFSTDSDGDGISDANEIAAGMNSGTLDSDGDGLLDIFEYGNQPTGADTDPANADSDGDGIPDGVDALPSHAIVFYHGDHLGSTTVQTNIRGDVISRIKYAPYGEIVGAAANDAAPRFGFTGQRHEQNAGLYDYGARFYDPLLARFISADSIIPDPGKLQSRNRYSYVRNNPLNRIDPSGNMDFKAGEEAKGTEESISITLNTESKTGASGASSGATSPSAASGVSSSKTDTDKGVDNATQAAGGSAAHSSSVQHDQEADDLLPTANVPASQSPAVKKAAHAESQSLPLPEVVAEKTEIGDIYEQHGIAIDRSESAQQDLENVKKARAWMNSAIASGEIQMPWLATSTIEGIRFDARSVSKGISDAFRGGAVRRGPNNNSPIVIFHDGATSVAMAVEAIGHEVKHFDGSGETSAREFGVHLRGLYEGGP